MHNPDRWLKGALTALLGFGVALAGVPVLWRGFAALYALVVRGRNYATLETKGGER